MLKSSSERGLESENLVIQHYASKGYRLIQQRVKTVFAEVDLIFQGKKGNLILVEVKSLSSWDFFQHRISEKQKKRLSRALQYYQSHGHIAALHYAVVSQQGEIRVFPDFFG